MKMKNRILSLLCCAALVLTMIPAVPIAIAMTKKVKKAKEALAAAQLAADS